MDHPTLIISLQKLIKHLKQNMVWIFVLLEEPELEQSMYVAKSDPSSHH